MENHHLLYCPQEQYAMSQTIIDLIEYSNNNRQGLLIATDSNSHHHWWGSNITCRRGKIWEEEIIRHTLYRGIVTAVAQIGAILEEILFAFLPESKRESASEE